jgi:3-hydroxymyristoyl/3-hydroxydecanoyl-(acyl carrier protein) dehydratase
VEDLIHKDIEKLLPHREPFLFVDKVLSIGSDGVTASKYLDMNAEYFKGHFPGRPLMPGVLMIESMAQTSGIACAAYFNARQQTSSEHPEMYFLSRVSDMRFKQPVFPGSTLIIKAQVTRYFEPFVVTHVSCKTNDNIVAEGELVLSKQKGGIS